MGGGACLKFKIIGVPVSQSHASPVSRWRSVTVDKLNFSQNLSGVGPQHHLHSKCEPNTHLVRGSMANAGNILHNRANSIPCLHVRCRFRFPLPKLQSDSALSVYVTALSPPSVRWLDGWCGAGDNLVWAGLLYQTEYRSKLKLSRSTKSDVVRLTNNYSCV